MIWLNGLPKATLLILFSYVSINQIITIYSIKNMSLKQLQYEKKVRLVASSAGLLLVNISLK